MSGFLSPLVTGLWLDAYREIQMCGSGRKVEQALLRAKEGRNG